MAINFPSSPTLGQLYTYGENTWQWSGDYWGVYSAQTGYVTSVTNSGSGFPVINSYSNNSLVLKSFSGTNMTITDSGGQLNFYVPLNGGSGGQLYYFNISKTQTPYLEIATSATTGSEQSITSAVTSGNTITLGQFLTPNGSPGVSIIPGGVWSFFLHSYKQNSSASFDIFCDVYKRTTGGTETYLFSSDSVPITSNSPTPSMGISDVYYSGTTLDTSDRILVNVRVTNTSSSTYSATFISEGLQHYSYFSSPLLLPTTDTYVNSFTYTPSANTITIGQTQNYPSQSITINSFSGLSVGTMSATTYQNLPSGSIATSGTTLYSTSPPTSNFNTSESIFLGADAGNGATGASHSNFFGFSVGFNASNANDSNFFGQFAGEDATNANYSNFLGSGAGQFATNSQLSNFLGNNAGAGAVNSYNSNFFGQFAGQNASNANNSNFLGPFAGSQAINASYSTLIGFRVGFASLSPNSIGSNNIIIGTNITLPSGTTNSLNLGGVLFGSNTYSAITGDPSLSAQTNGRIGINITTPSEALHVSGNTRIVGGLSATTISATTYLNLPQDIFVTGGTYDTGTSTITFTNNSGGTFNVSGITSSGGGSFTGGTVTGATNFTNGLTANTISATTYQNLPVSGLTQGSNITITNNGQGNFTISSTGGSSSGLTYGLVVATSLGYQNIF